MPSTNPRLGDCPRCGASIHDRHILVAYGPDDRPRYWADCPGCGDVVAPKG
ncbi:DUF7837 family putative zinc-binding protein [Halobacterium sp. KA-4]|uniref:DUF7837 family putative zinc-binding protein n=1 Tax=Halobacterium sp. KA-4 TaxID=2896367 RepID=UPI003FA5692A